MEILLTCRVIILHYSSYTLSLCPVQNVLDRQQCVWVVKNCYLGAYIYIYIYTRAETSSRKRANGKASHFTCAVQLLCILFSQKLVFLSLTDHFKSQNEQVFKSSYALVCFVGKRRFKILHYNSAHNGLHSNLKLKCVIFFPMLK